MRACDAPRPRAASTYCSSFNDSTTARITRPPKGIRVMAIAIITVPVPAPSAIAMAMANIRSGNDCRNSNIRWLKISNRPPKYPLAIPHSAPTVVPSSTADTATVNEARLP